MAGSALSPSFSILVSSVARTESDGVHPAESHGHRQTLLWEDLFSNPLEWWDNRLDKRSPRHPDFRHKRTKEPLWLNNQYKPRWVDSWLRTLDAEAASDSGGFPALGMHLQSSCDGQLDRALCVLDQQSSVPPVSLYSSLLEACAKKKALAQVQRVHAHLTKRGLEFSGFLGENVVRALVTCGGLVDALEVFRRLPHRTVLSWTAVISGYAMSGQGEQAIKLYKSMQEEGVQPNTYTFVCLLKACGSTANLDEGKRIHTEALKYNLESDMFVRTSLVDMYRKCGSVEDARTIFDRVPHRNVVLWNAMMATYAQHSQPEEALELYEQMQREGVSPNARTFVSVLQACGMLADNEDGVIVDGQSTKVKSLAKGRAIHVDAQEKGYDLDLFVGNTLISMYGRCGSLPLAHIVFDQLSQRDVVSWTAMLAAYAQQGQAEKVLQLYEAMGEDGLSPDHRTFVPVLQACGMLAEREGETFTHGRANREKYLERGKAVHADARRKGYDSEVFVSSTLITMYGKCGSIVNARDVFDKLFKRSIVAWTAILGVYTRQGEGLMAMQMYEQMQEEGVRPDKCTLVTALQACILMSEAEDFALTGQPSKGKSLEKGKELHATALSKGFGSDVFVGNALITMYGKCGSIEDAQAVFDGLLQRDLVSWTSMLAAYIRNGQPEIALELYEEMRKGGLSPDKTTYLSLCQACATLAEDEEESILDGKASKLKSLQKGKELHADAERKSYASDVLVGNSLVNMYGKCGSILDAENVFGGLPERNQVSWTVLLAAYVRQGQPEKALELYEQMQEQGVSPMEHAVVSALQACGNVAERDVDVVINGLSTKLKPLGKGKVMHAHAERKGFCSNDFVGSALISMYGKCGSIVDAENVFDGLSKCVVVPWNMMLAAYSQLGLASQVLQLYSNLLEEEVSPDVWTIVIALQSCGTLADSEEDTLLDAQPTRVGALEAGKAVHAAAHRNGLDWDVFVGSTLISMYGKCGSIVDAQSVFDGLSHCDVVSWNAMLAAVNQQGQGDKALQLYRKMEEEGIRPNEITLMCMLQASSTTGSIGLCKQIHHTIGSAGTSLCPLLATTLIHAYGRCASMVDALMVFDCLPQPDVTAWTALIAGYARLGNYSASLRYFKEMKRSGMKPNRVTFLSLLSACSHGGLVDEGLEHFESMSRDYDITPEIEHYVSVIDLLGRAGCFDKVETFLSTMPVQPNLSMWLCVLGACRKHGKIGLGKLAFDHARRLQPKDAAAYIMMCNIYARAGQWDCTKEVIALEQKAGAWKLPGQSWISYQEEVHSFMVADCNHPLKNPLYGLLGKLRSALDAEEQLLQRDHWI